MTHLSGAAGAIRPPFHFITFSKRKKILHPECYWHLRSVRDDTEKPSQQAEMLHRTDYEGMFSTWLPRIENDLTAVNSVLR